VKLDKGLPRTCGHGGGVLVEGRQVHTAVRGKEVPPALHGHMEKQSEGGGANGDRKVHRPRVVGDGEACTLHEGGQLVQAGRRGQEAARGMVDKLLCEGFFPGPPDDEGGAA